MEYIAVIIANLPVGLKLDCKVYIRKDNDYIYLCDNVKVTPRLIKRFESAAPDECIYITAECFEVFASRGIDLSPRKITDFERVAADFENAKAISKELMEAVAITGRIDNNKTDDFITAIRKQIESNDISLILQSINMLRGHDEYLYNHSLNVAFLNGLIGKWLGYGRETVKELVKTGLLHDVGKLKVPAEILGKPGILTSKEFSEVKKHPGYGYDIMKESNVIPECVLEGVLQHHEKLNGTGYPSGLQADQIGEFARITAISDMYDAMVTKRVYKDAHSPFVILENFSQEGYSQLDIYYVKMFIDCMIGELKGKHVVLSNGKIAKVVMVNQRNLTYPMVEVDGHVIITSPELFVVSMHNHHHSEEEVANI